MEGAGRPHREHPQLSNRVGQVELHPAGELVETVKSLADPVNGQT